jgi:GrpB-like predicted nucleotidyltransferase (UPF0157 family)
VAHDETFTLAADPDAARLAAQELFTTVQKELATLLPPSAEVLHIGATAIPGCLTKGDLDIVVRVARPDFANVERLLASRFARNSGSVCTEEFAAFEEDERSPHLGIQLTVVGGPLDVFHYFAEALRDNSDLVRRYNEIKLGCSGQPMADYRAAKDIFIGRVLASCPLRPHDDA